MLSELIEAWRMGEDANLFLLDKLPRGALRDAYAPRTRDVGQQFAHMHAVRLRWLEHAAPSHAKGIAKVPKEPPPTKAALRKALKASSAAIEAFLTRCEADGKVPSWRGSPTTFLSYLVAHESHHRALAMVALRAAGRKLPQEVVYGLWDWGKRRSARG